MNYHFFIDEKFINDFITDAESIDSNQYYIVLSEAPLHFVTHNKAVYLQYNAPQLETLIAGITEADRLFIHWFQPSLMQLIDRIPRQTRVYLLFWGGDFLESALPPGNNTQLDRFLYDPLTRSFVHDFHIKRTHELLNDRMKRAWESGNLKNRIHTALQQFSLRKKYLNGHFFEREWKTRQAFLRRIEAICHWNHFDISLLEELYQVKLKQQYFIYNVGIEKMERIAKPSSSKTLTIWLGNSDTPTNNHLDALAALSPFKDEDIQIICPLNYGNREYGDLIESEGKRIFGGKWLALRNYLSRDEYYSLMNETDVAIMFHNRGQAGGNVIAFLKKGIKVYMKDQSSICQLFREMGITIYSANKIQSLSFEELKAPVSADEVERNIQLINSTIGNEEKRIKALEALLKEEGSN